MYFYEVWVSSQNYHGSKPLTYTFDSQLQIGTIVAVPLQQRVAVAVVSRKVVKPSFPTKHMHAVIDSNSLPQQALELLTWLMHYYPGPTGQIVSLFVPTILSAKSRKTAESSGPTRDASPLPTLTDEQTEAVKAIQKEFPRSILLHGDTGTGKTRVYMELAKSHLAQNRSVVMLTPEIGLTPQLTAAFQEAFPGQVAVMHSGLTPASRRNVWLKILRSSHPLIVIGPRSALFAPLKNVGVVVIDEFHEPSYKQEQAPYYLTSRVAAKLAQLHGAQLILGSATPLVSDYYTFKEKNLPIVRMTTQAAEGPAKPTKVKLIDLKDKQLFSRSPWISDALIAAIKEAQQEKQQALIFLNRRGTARLVLCQACGWQASCPNCDLPLTYHGDSHKMLCHTCGHAEYAPSSCPSCGAENIIFKSIGTKALVTEVKRLIPSATVQRFDSDTGKNEHLEQHYTSVREGSVDILVGTQMLGKGLDLPKLSVVGIITAETSLSFPDYTSDERTYQLICQALGRVNRGHVPGTAIVQTYHPDSQLLQAAIQKNYQQFYEQQIEERKLYGFPPFRFLLKLSCTRASSSSAKKASSTLADKLRQDGNAVEVVGPNPAFAAKTHGKYHWQIIVKAASRQVLLNIIQDLPANWSYDVDPMSLL